MDVVSGCMASGNGPRYGSGYLNNGLCFSAVQAIAAILAMQRAVKSFAHGCTSIFRNFVAKKSTSRSKIPFRHRNNLNTA
jgi:hypothetical protein